MTTISIPTRVFSTMSIGAGPESARGPRKVHAHSLYLLGRQAPIKDRGRDKPAVQGAVQADVNERDEKWKMSANTIVLNLMHQGFSFLALQRMLPEVSHQSNQVDKRFWVVWCFRVFVHFCVQSISK